MKNLPIIAICICVILICIASFLESRGFNSRINDLERAIELDTKTDTKFRQWLQKKLNPNEVQNENEIFDANEFASPVITDFNGTKYCR